MDNNHLELHQRMSDATERHRLKSEAVKNIQFKILNASPIQASSFLAEYERLKEEEEELKQQLDVARDNYMRYLKSP